MNFKFKIILKKFILMILLNLIIVPVYTEDLNIKKKVEDRIINFYFIFDLGTSYLETEKIIIKNGLKYNKNENIIKIYPASTDGIKFKYSLLIFTDNILTNIIVYIDEPVTFMGYFINSLKKGVNIGYTDINKETAVWTDNEITIELKIIKEDAGSKKIFCLQYYKNEFKNESVSEKELKMLDKNNFLEISLMGGPSFPAWGNPGGLIGFGFSYQYKFSKYFAFGPGISGFLSMIWSPGYSYHDDDGSNYSYPGNMSYLGSGGVISACFMFGELDNYKIAFLLDVGGGWMFSVKMGILIKMITFKIGYSQTGMGYAHNLSFELGYKFNFSSKKKGNPLRRE